MSAPQNDAYGNAVTAQINVNGFDIYTNIHGVSASVATGTSPGPAFVSIAIQTNLFDTKNLAMSLVGGQYDLDTRMNLLGMARRAQANGLTNRFNYIDQLETWAEAIESYLTGYVASVLAMTNPATIAATTPDFSSFMPGGASADPQVTIMGALEITN